MMSHKLASYARGNACKLRLSDVYLVAAQFEDLAKCIDDQADEIEQLQTERQERKAVIDDALVAEIKRLQVLYRQARKAECGWEIADRFDYVVQHQAGCRGWEEQFDQETERRLLAAERGGE